MSRAPRFRLARPAHIRGLPRLPRTMDARRRRWAAIIAHKHIHEGNGQCRSARREPGPPRRHRRSFEHFYFDSRYGARRSEPGISDFTFGNPHELPLAGITSGDPLRGDRAQQGLVRLQDQRAGGLRLPCRCDDAASSASPSSRPTSRSPPAPSAPSPWPSGSSSTPATKRSSPSRAGSATSRRSASPTRCRARSGSPGRASTSTSPAIDAAIGPRTRLVIVNTPHNPTGRIYDRAALEALGEMLERASQADRPAHLPPLRRALSAAPLRRPRLRQPGGGLSVDADLLQLRQGAAHARTAARLSGAVAADAARRPRRARGAALPGADGDRLVVSERRHAVLAAASSRSSASTSRR